MYFRTLDKKECSACGACLNVCPKRCISMKQDEEGFLYPVIDKEICINCGLCEKVCPVSSPKYENEQSPKVYASYIKDEKERMKSTSGGLFYAIATWIISQGGIVYGAAFDADFKLKHLGAETVQDLQKLRGSKYVQSDIGRVFSEIKEQLEKGRWVYFTGVGCQVAGLKAYLRKDYAHLITSDLVCHGVPSQLMFDWHIDYLQQKEQAKIISYSFRDCEGWEGCEIYRYVKNGKTRQRKLHGYSLSPYLHSFMYSYNLRYSCYDCKFAKIPRQGDFTLADYWGVRRIYPNLDVSKGVSLVLMNNRKAENLWSHIEGLLEYKLSNIEDAARENGNLVHTTQMPEIRKYCYELIKERGYASVAEKEFRVKKYHMLKLKLFVAHSKIGPLLMKLKNIIR